VGLYQRGGEYLRARDLWLTMNLRDSISVIFSRILNVNSEARKEKISFLLYLKWLFIRLSSNGGTTIPLDLYAAARPSAPPPSTNVPASARSAVAKITGPKVATAAVTLGYVLLW